jgi:hypothetical protein
MTLTAAHKELIRLLAAEAVDHYLDEHHNLLQTTKEEPMRETPIKERQCPPSKKENAGGNFVTTP